MGHVHAKEMAEYAKDALETDRPLERWQVSFSDGFIGVEGHHNWSVNHKMHDSYWTITCRGVCGFSWDDCEEDNEALKNGFIHLTKEAAQKHFDALRSFTAVESKHEE